jgi:hypothetical protein
MDGGGPKGLTNVGLKRVKATSERTEKILTTWLGETIFGRLAQLAEDEISKSKKDANALNVTVQCMHDIGSWPPEDWDEEVPDLIAQMPKFQDELTKFVIAQYQLFYGQVPYEEDLDMNAVTKTVVTRVYKGAAQHFSAYPLCVCTGPENDPRGEIYTSGIKAVEGIVRKVLRVLVPRPAVCSLQKRPVIVVEEAGATKEPETETIKHIPMRRRPLPFTGEL